MHQKHLFDNLVSKLIKNVGTTHTMLHKNLHLYPYHRVTAVQKLKPADYPRRLHLCNNVLVCI
jgi:hypothetical protein